MNRYACYGENNWFLGEIEKFLVALNARKSLATSQKRSLLPKNALKCVANWGSAPDPAEGAYSTRPDPIVVGKEGRGGDGVQKK